MTANRKNVPAGVRFWSIQGVSCPIRYVPIHRANPAHLGGVHLREEHEHHGTDGDGTAEYIEQEENEQEEAGYSQGISEEEVQADENQRNNHSRNSVINKFLAAYLINDDKSQNGGQSID